MLNIIGMKSLKTDPTKSYLNNEVILESKSFLFQQIFFRVY